MTSKKTTTPRTAVWLTALTLTPPLWSIVAHDTNAASLGTAAARAQTRLGNFNQDGNRDSQQASDFHNSSLSRPGRMTVSGEVTSDPFNNSFEFYGENGTRYRVLATSDVSLRGIDRNDRVQIHGKLDRNIFIASSVTGMGASNSAVLNLRANVVNDLSGNRFTIRQGNAIRTVVAERGEPFGLRVGSEVDMTGQWRNDIFYASSVRLLDSGWDDNWRDGQVRRIRGTVTSDLSSSRFTLRTDDRLDVTVSTAGSSIRRISRGDVVEVQGRWDRNSNIFRGTRATVLRDNDDDFNNGRRADFEGQITRASRTSNGWLYTVRTRGGRHVTVRYNRQFRTGDRVEVEGVVQNNVVIATKMDRI